MQDSYTISPSSVYIFRTGMLRRHGLTLYRLNGAYICRSISSLTGKRVKESVQFKKTMQFAANMGRAASIAAAVYRQLPEGWKLHSLYRRLAGVGSRLLKDNIVTNEELTAALWQYLHSIGFHSDIQYEVVQQSTTVYQEPVVQKTIQLRCKKRRRTAIRSKHKKACVPLISKYKILNSVYTSTAFRLSFFNNGHSHRILLWSG